MNKNRNYVLESDEKWSSQLVKCLQIVVYNVKLLILVILTSVLRALVNKTQFLNFIRNRHKRVTMLEFLTYISNFFSLMFAILNQSRI